MMDLWLLVFLFNGQVYASGPFDAATCLEMSVNHVEPSNCVRQEFPTRKLPVQKFADSVYYNRTYSLKDLKTDETYWKCNKECFIFDNDQFLEHLRRANYAGYRRGLEESKVNK